MPLRKPYIFFLMFFLGGLSALSLAPLNFMPACFIGFSFFAFFLHKLYLCDKFSSKEKIYLFAFIGWSFGLGYFSAGLWWIPHALTIFDWRFIFLVPVLTLVIGAFLSLYWALATVMAYFLWRDNLARFFGLAISFGFFEWLRGILFTGFPWNSIGYNLMPIPLLMQPAAFIGLYGVNIFAVFLFTLPAAFLQKCERWKAFFIFCTFFMCDIALGFYYLKHNNNEKFHPYTVRLVQPSILQTTNFSSKDRMKNLEKLLKLTNQKTTPGQPLPDLIIWPETSVPYILAYNPSVTERIIQDLKEKQIILLGTISVENNLYSGKEVFFNSIEAINGQGRILARSDKKHLVPFGEYTPYASLLNALGLNFLEDIWDTYNAAKERQTVKLPNGLAYLPLICYEAIFPTEMDYKGPRPDFIVNITNDAWFNNTTGPYQHFQQARLRAVEQRLPLLRIANNGISAIIDPYGRVISSLSLNKIGVIDNLLPASYIGPSKSPPGNFIFFLILCAFTVAYSFFIYENPRHENDKL